ncbi:BMP family lipoprotein [Vallitalea guaymasensis]|uniref:BMP family lipoprotein n=1 Tax=Vallitalea guaymasensis TaxID=1185412 RepID=UPI000DE23E68|nr:BMP family ABC transporter substrate-binding protein [Vallitalea guaymasensis]
MNLKKVFAIMLCLTLLLVGCTKTGDNNNNNTDTDNKDTAKDKTFKVAMVTSAGGLGDRSYNDSAYEGLKKIEADMNMEIKVVEPADVSEGEKYLTELAKAGYDLVCTLEYGHADILNTVAPQFPDTRFAIFNIVVDQPNVTSVIFKEHEGSFLAGALAAMVTTDDSIDKTNDQKIISAIGGVQSPGIDKFIVGYEEGAKYIDPDIKVLKGYSNSFGDPAKGKELALVQIDQGSDVVYQIAGGTGEGVFEAVKEKNVFAVGVDSDQDYIVPGNILTSMMKRLDMAMVMLADKLQEGTIGDENIIELGLKEGTELSPMEHTKDMLKPEYLDQLEEIREKIVSGEIKVTDVTKE